MIPTLALALLSGAFSTAEAAPFDDSTFSVEAHSLAMPGDATFGVGARMEGRRGAFLDASARSQFTGDWTGRMTAGFDVFDGWDGFDLTLGLALAGVGDWREAALYGSPGLGFDFGVAGHMGRLHASYRSVIGKDSTPVGRGLAEKQWRLGFDVIPEQLQIFGESLVVYNDVEQLQQTHAYGLGAQLTF